jgi:hypothetical protein
VHETTNAEPEDTDPGHRDTGSRRENRYRRPGLGILAGLAVLLIVALPAGVLVWFAFLAFSGCFIECSKPQPAVGTLWAAEAVRLISSRQIDVGNHVRYAIPLVEAPRGLEAART